MLGVVAAGLTAMNQLSRPAQRSTSRYRAANALRQHGWDFVLGRGRYRHDEKKNLDQFVDDVARVLRDAEAIDETAPEISSGS